MVTLQGAAQNADPDPVALRVAEHDGGIVLDLGGADGRAVVRSGRFDARTVGCCGLQRSRWGGDRLTLPALLLDLGRARVTLRAAREGTGSPRDPPSPRSGRRGYGCTGRWSWGC